jgi:hypothetical protein
MPSTPDTMSCDPSQTGLRAELSITPPAHGSFYQVGEAPLLTIRLLSGCQKVLAPAELGTAALYLVGPRGALTTRSASTLLNAVTDRAAKDRQHHYINLISPAYANPSQGGLKTLPDGSLQYQLAPITKEAAGTYTAAVRVKSKDEVEQIFPMLDLQIGTATVEKYASGDPNASSCADCHKGPSSGKMYMHHIEPGSSAVGNWASICIRSRPASCATTKTATAPTQRCARFTPFIEEKIKPTPERPIQSTESRPMARWRCTPTSASP